MVSNNIFNAEELFKCVKSKEEMYNELNGRIVKCVKASNENCTMFAVQDIETKKIYFLDQIIN